MTHQTMENDARKAGEKTMRKQDKENNMNVGGLVGEIMGFPQSLFTRTSVVKKKQGKGKTGGKRAEGECENKTKAAAGKEDPARQKN